MYPLLVLSCTHYYMFTYSTCLCVEEVFELNSHDLVVPTVFVNDPFQHGSIAYVFTIVHIVCYVLHVLSHCRS